VTFEGLTAAHVKLWRLDADHGNVLRAFDAMGRPAFPSAQQIDQLRAASKLTAPEDGVLPTGGLEVWVPGQGLVVAEISH
jgi:xylan 1,4-beta-xylosidase